MATNLLEQIQALKTQAKNRRDLERYDRAVPILNQAIELALRELEGTGVKEWQTQLAAELADCFGLVGGIERRWALDSRTKSEDRMAHLVASMKAYDQGYGYESSKDYGLVNSYNLVNRIIGRILYAPQCLTEDWPLVVAEGVDSMVVRQELQRTSEVIRKQLAGPRRGDYWAHADLALVTILLGAEKPTVAYSSFLEQSPPEYAYESVLSTLRPLVHNLTPPLPVNAELKEAISLLEARLDRLRSGVPC